LASVVERVGRFAGSNDLAGVPNRRRNRCEVRFRQGVPSVFVGRHGGGRVLLAAGCEGGGVRAAEAKVAPSVVGGVSGLGPVLPYFDAGVGEGREDQVSE
jgi:ribosomal protein S5